MNGFKKITIFIIGTVIGFITGGVIITKTALKSDIIRKSVINVISNKFIVLVYGNNKPKNLSYRDGRVRYRDMQDQKPTNRRGFNCEDIIFESQRDAELVIDAMSKIISQYGVVSVGDLYDLAHISTDNYTANKYGWTNLNDINLVRTRAGYRIKLLKPTLLK